MEEVVRNKNVMPGSETTDEYKRETQCPSCGRFIGVFERCPYCQTVTRKRLSVRIFKVLSVVTSTLGLLLLLFYAQRIKTPVVTIKSLGPLSNFGHVRIVGVVERSYGIHKQWKSLGFVVKDGSGESIRISAYSKVAVGIEQKGKVPDEGDTVSVEGQVRFQKDQAGMLINAEEHLEILKKSDVWQSTKEYKLSEIVESMVGDMAIVEGRIGRLDSYANRGVNVKIKGDGKTLSVWIPTNVLAEKEFSGKPGDVYKFLGKVGTFRDFMQVQLVGKNGVKEISKAPAGSAQEPEGDGE